MICLESSASSGMSCKDWRSDWAAEAKLSCSFLAKASRRASSLAESRLAVVELWPSLLVSSGASGAICWITDSLPSALAPSSPREVPPSMPPEPLVVDEMLAGAK